MKKSPFYKVNKDLFVTLLLSSCVSVALLLIRVFVTQSMHLVFLIWNLFLAWIPLFFAFWLKAKLKTNHKPSWKEYLLGCLWLIFLPNSFYIISDLIHLQSSGDVSLLYDTAMVMSFVINGLLLGYISLYIVHKSVIKYLGSNGAFIFAQFAILLSGFAIYLGRYLRWNTWDIVFNPAGLVFDVSDRIINPGTHTFTFVVTGVFYIILGSTYAVLYRLAEILKITQKD